MKKIILTSLAAMLVASGANAAEIRPYVSQKISYGDAEVYNLHLKGDATEAHGTNEHDWTVGSRTAVGAVYANEAIKGAIRAELEFGFNAKSNFDITNKDVPTEKFNGEMSIFAYGLNFYYDFNAGKGIKPYLGAGTGFATVDYKLSHALPGGTGEISGEGKDTAYMWNVFAGVSYALTANLDLDLGYRYTRYGDFAADLTVSGTGTAADGDQFLATATLASHKITVGARYAF